MVRRVCVWAMTVVLLASFLTLGASATLPEGVSEGSEREYRDLLDRCIPTVRRPILSEWQRAWPK